MIFFVSTTSLHRCHKKILIFKGAFIFHKSLFKLDTSKWIRHDNVISSRIVHLELGSSKIHQAHVLMWCYQCVVTNCSMLLTWARLDPYAKKRLGGDVPRSSAMVTCGVKDTDHIKLYYPAIYPLKMELVIHLSQWMTQIEGNHA